LILKLLGHFGNKYEVPESYINAHGFGNIKKNIVAYNNASAYSAYFVLTDLDRKKCAPGLISEWLNKEKSPNLIFRVAVREVEAWLLADRKNFSLWTGLSEVNIPKNSEQEEDPKALLINLIKKSRKRLLKEDILPAPNAKLGPNYNGRMIEFVNNHWDIEKAAENCNSLKKAIVNLERYQFKPL